MNFKILHDDTAIGPPATGRISGYWKVPFRQVYCRTLRVWLASTIFCHIVIKLNPNH